MRAFLLLASVVFVALVTSGCHIGLFMVAAGAALDQGPYRAETLATELGGESVRTLGCLDVGLALYEREGDKLVDLHVGNRCSHPEALDMRRAVIRGVDEQGEQRTVTLYDPRNEVVRMHVGGSEKGRERLRLENVVGLAGLCFDLSGIAPDAPAARPSPVCFERKNGWKASAGGFT
jgi:hypothetical protein